MDNDKMLEIFKQFMAHAANLECFHNLWRSTDQQSFFMPEPEHNWSNILYTEVEQTLQKLRKAHSELIYNVTGRKIIME